MFLAPLFWDFFFKAGINNWCKVYLVYNKHSCILIPVYSERAHSSFILLLKLFVNLLADFPRRVRQQSNKVKHTLDILPTHCPLKSTPGSRAMNTHVHTKIYMQMLKTSIFLIAKKRKQPKNSSAGKYNKFIYETTDTLMNLKM